MRSEPGFHGPHRDLRRPSVRETEDARGDAAERDGAYPVREAQVEHVSIAVRQILFQFLRQRPLYDGSDDVDDVFCWQIVSVRQHRDRRRLFVVFAEFRAKQIHAAGTFRPELDPGKRVDAVVDAGVHRDKTAQHLRIGRVHDGVDGQPGDIALPEGNAVRDLRDPGKGHDPVLPVSFLQVFVLHLKDFAGHLFRHADIHQRPERASLILRVFRRLQIPVPHRILFECFDQIIQSFLLIHSVSHPSPSVTAIKISLLLSGITPGSPPLRRYRDISDETPPQGLSDPSIHHDSLKRIIICCQHEYKKCFGRILSG